jgi:hypothetical protein
LEKADFVKRYPVLYHLSSDGAWPNLWEYGLLSTTAILDRWGIVGKARERLESRQRRVTETLQHPKLGSIELRDQKVLPESKLRMCLTGCTPSEWYRLINRKVFFWATWDRVAKLLSARAYRKIGQTLLVVDTESLMNTYFAQTTLCHRNSGQVVYIHERSLHKDILLPISEYPVSRTGRPVREVAEVAVDYAVPCLRRHVVEVRRMVGSSCSETIFSR